MKLRILSLALLASMALTTMETQASQAKQNAAAALPKLQAESAEVKQKAAKRLDVAAHGGNPLAALKAATNAIGGPGANINAKIADVNNILGAGHAAAVPHAAANNTHDKAANLLERLKAIPNGQAIVAAPAAVSIEAWLGANGA